MFEEFSTTADKFLEAHKLELIWLGVFSLFIHYLVSLFKEKNKTFSNKNKGQHFYIKCPYRTTYKVILGVMIFFGLLFPFIIYQQYQEGEFKEAFMFLGGLLNMILILITDREVIDAKIQQDQLILGGRKFKRESIESLALWDDLITIHRKEGKKREMNISYSEKTFRLVTQMIEALKEYCEVHGIPVEDQFAREKEKNEVLNPPKVKVGTMKVS